MMKKVSMTLTHPGLLQNQHRCSTGTLAFVGAFGSELAAGTEGRTGGEDQMSFSTSLISESISRCAARSTRISRFRITFLGYAISGVPNVVPPPPIIQLTTRVVGSFVNGTLSRPSVLLAKSRFHRGEKCWISAEGTERSMTCFSVLVMPSTSTVNGLHSTQIST